MVPPGMSMSLSFGPEEGRMEGYDGCNYFFGSYVTKSEDSLSTIHVNVRGSTLRGCSYDLESQFNSVLNTDGLIYDVNGNELTFYSVTTDEDGNSVQGDLMAQFLRVVTALPLEG